MKNLPLLHWHSMFMGVALLASGRSKDARKRIGHLDLDREKARYGAQTRGGIGISVSA